MLDFISFPFGPNFVIFNGLFAGAVIAVVGAGLGWVIGMVIT